MATYTVKMRTTTPVTGTTGTAANRDAAIIATLAAIAASTGPTGREPDIFTCDLVGATGPTGIYATTYNVNNPVTGVTFSAVSADDAIRQAVAAGPTGPQSGIDIWSASL